MGAPLELLPLTIQDAADNLLHRIPFNLVRADHWYNKPVKKATRPSKEDYKYYFTHNVSITTSGFFSTQGLKFCIDELGLERCMYSIGKPASLENLSILS